LADFIIENNHVETILEAYLKACEENAEDPDKSVAALKDHPELIVSPIKGKKIDVTQIISEEEAIKKADDDDGNEGENEPDA
jgi:hypothetical protein